MAINPNDTDDLMAQLLQDVGISDQQALPQQGAPKTGRKRMFSSLTSWQAQNSSANTPPDTTVTTNGPSGSGKKGSSSKKSQSGASSVSMAATASHPPHAATQNNTSTYTTAVPPPALTTQPIDAYRYEFCRTLAVEKKLVVVGAPGCGKSTRLPHFAAADPLLSCLSQRHVPPETFLTPIASDNTPHTSHRNGMGHAMTAEACTHPWLSAEGSTRGIILCTQPHAFAVRSVAQRIAEEMGTRVGEGVGVMLTSHTDINKEAVRVIIATDEAIARVAVRDALLLGVSVLIADEAHTRTVASDVILAVSKRISQIRDDFHLVICSATINCKEFSDFLFGANPRGRRGKQGKRERHMGDDDLYGFTSSGTDGVGGGFGREGGCGDEELEGGAARYGDCRGVLVVPSRTFDITEQITPIAPQDTDDDVQYIRSTLLPALWKAILSDGTGHVLVFARDAAHALLWREEAEKTMELIVQEERRAEEERVKAREKRSRDAARGLEYGYGYWHGSEEEERKERGYGSDSDSDDEDYEEDEDEDDEESHSDEDTEDVRPDAAKDQKSTSTTSATSSQSTPALTDAERTALAGADAPPLQFMCLHSSMDDGELVAASQHANTYKPTVLDLYPQVREIVKQHELMREQTRQSARGRGGRRGNASSRTVGDTHDAQAREKVERTKRMVYFCDTVAETAVTIPEVRVVLDLGRVVVNWFDEVKNVELKKEEWVTRDRAQQRSGRTGRTNTGHCIRLYNPALCAPRVVPEVKRVSQARVVLQLAALGMHPLHTPMVEAPHANLVLSAVNMLRKYRCLEESGGAQPLTSAALDTHRAAGGITITEKGRIFARMPLEPASVELLWAVKDMSAAVIVAVLRLCCAWSISGPIFAVSPAATKQAVSAGILRRAQHSSGPSFSPSNSAVGSEGVDVASLLPVAAAETCSDATLMVYIMQAWQHARHLDTVIQRQRQGTSRDASSTSPSSPSSALSASGAPPLAATPAAAEALPSEAFAAQYRLVPDTLRAIDEVFQLVLPDIAVGLGKSDSELSAITFPWAPQPPAKPSRQSTTTSSTLQAHTTSTTAAEVPLPLLETAIARALVQSMPERVAVALMEHKPLMGVTLQGHQGEPLSATISGMTAYADHYTRLEPRAYPLLYALRLDVAFSGHYTVSLAHPIHLDQLTGEMRGALHAFAQQYKLRMAWQSPDCSARVYIAFRNLFMQKVQEVWQLHAQLVETAQDQLPDDTHMWHAWASQQLQDKLWLPHAILDHTRVRHAQATRSTAQTQLPQVPLDASSVPDAYSVVYGQGQLHVQVWAPGTTGASVQTLLDSLYVKALTAVVEDMQREHKDMLTDDGVGLTLRGILADKQLQLTDLGVGDAYVCRKVAFTAEEKDRLRQCTGDVAKLLGCAEKGTGSTATAAEYERMLRVVSRLGERRDVLAAQMPSGARTCRKGGVGGRKDKYEFIVGTQMLTGNHSKKVAKAHTFVNYALDMTVQRSQVRIAEVIENYFAGKAGIGSDNATHGSAATQGEQPWVNAGKGKKKKKKNKGKSKKDAGNRGGGSQQGYEYSAFPGDESDTREYTVYVSADERSAARIHRALLASPHLQWKVSPAALEHNEEVVNMVDAHRSSAFPFGKTFFPLTLNIEEVPPELYSQCVMMQQRFIWASDSTHTGAACNGTEDTKKANGSRKDVAAADIPDYVNSLLRGYSQGEHPGMTAQLQRLLDNQRRRNHFACSDVQCAAGDADGGSGTSTGTGSGSSSGSSGKTGGEKVSNQRKKDSAVGATSDASAGRTQADIDAYQQLIHGLCDASSCVLSITLEDGSGQAVEKTVQLYGLADITAGVRDALKTKMRFSVSIWERYLIIFRNLPAAWAASVDLGVIQECVSHVDVENLSSVVSNTLCDSSVRAGKPNTGAHSPSGLARYVRHNDLHENSARPLPKHAITAREQLLKDLRLAQEQPLYYGPYRVAACFSCKVPSYLEEDALRTMFADKRVAVEHLNMWKQKQTHGLPLARHGSTSTEANEDSNAMADGEGDKATTPKRPLFVYGTQYAVARAKAAYAVATSPSTLYVGSTQSSGNRKIREMEDSGELSQLFAKHNVHGEYACNAGGGYIKVYGKDAKNVNDILVHLSDTIAKYAKSNVVFPLRGPIAEMAADKRSALYGAIQQIPDEVSRTTNSQSNVTIRIEQALSDRSTCTIHLDTSDEDAFTLTMSRLRNLLSKWGGQSGNNHCYKCQTSVVAWGSTSLALCGHSICEDCLAASKGCNCGSAIAISDVYQCMTADRARKILLESFSQLQLLLFTSKDSKPSPRAALSPPMQLKDRQLCRVHLRTCACGHVEQDPGGYYPCGRCGMGNCGMCGPGDHLHEGLPCIVYALVRLYRDSVQQRLEETIRKQELALRLKHSEYILAEWKKADAATRAATQRTIRDMAHAFLTTKWPAFCARDYTTRDQCPNPPTLTDHPSLPLAQCASVSRFLRGVHECHGQEPWMLKLLHEQRIALNVVSLRDTASKKMLDVWDNVFLFDVISHLIHHDLVEVAFHATIDDAVAPICDQGFDPGRRGKNGQVYGEGEYFANHPGVTYRYASERGYVLLSLILRQNKVNNSFEWGYVVKNDDKWRSSYCLPLGYIMGVGKPKAVTWTTCAVSEEVEQHLMRVWAARAEAQV